MEGVSVFYTNICVVTSNILLYWIIQVSVYQWCHILSMIY